MYKNDAPNTGFAVLGFFIPIAGLIMYLVMKDETPLRAKSAGKGALAGFITSVSLSLILGLTTCICAASSFAAAL